MEEGQDIQSDIVKQKQLRDAQENQEFDDAVAGGTLEDLRKGVDIKKKLKDQIKNGYIKPIQLDSSQGFEDLQLQFDSAGNKTIFGQPKTVEQRVDDYNGMGSGRIVIKGKTNTPEGIYFYPDNTEANKKTALDLYRAQTIFNAPTILAPLITAGKALGGKYFYMPPKKPLNTIYDKPVQAITPARPGLKDSLIKAIKGTSTLTQKTLNPIFTASELGLPTGTYSYAYEEETPNYNPILGEDELTESFKPQWQRKARQGDKTFYYDITGHRILDVPGMDNQAEQSRYKSWLTQSLINRYNSQLINPQTPFTHFHSNQSFYDSQGMEWRLVRTDKNASGPEQPYEPMPLNEIDSRKLKAENTNEEERVLLRSLMRLNVTDRNALERENPWLIRWNSDTSGQNYHEHMIGLDETEFWNSGAGKALGYMNNDVYDIEKGLGNIVFLNDPRFKIMKDNIAEYITPSSKEEVYPGLKRRTNPVKRFTGGPYAGMNAVIGYDANPKSSTYTNLVIHAYNPNPDINESQVVATLPNWYANVYAKDLTTGERIIPENIANSFVQSYVDSVLEGNQPAIIALEDLGEALLERYGINKQIPTPGGLQQDPDYQSLGSYTKPVDPDPLDLKTFKTTPKIQRDRDKWWKKNLNYWKKGKYTQLKLDLNE